MIIYLAGFGHPMEKTPFFKQRKPNVLLTFFGIVTRRLHMVKQGKEFMKKRKEVQDERKE